MKHPENWKPMTEFDGIFHISDHGRLKSFRQDPIEGKIIRPKKSKGIYLQYIIRYKGEYLSFYSHRKVAEYFIPNPKNLPYVDHIDNKNKLNNHVSNLQWVYHDENVRKDQAYTIICTNTDGTVHIAKGTRHAAQLTGITRANVQYSLKNNRSTRNGWSFKYKK